MHRMGFCNLTRAGKAVAADMDAVTRAQLWLPELIIHLGVSPKVLMNLDETALFPACQPRKTWAIDATAGVKTAKDRLTVAFICNVDGFETFRPMICTAFIEPLNASFFAEAMQVVLLVDDASSHRMETETAVRENILGFRTVKLSNIRVVYLPPNTTAFTQPLDQGVISAVKARFRQKVIVDWLRLWDDSGSPASMQSLKPTTSATVVYLFEALDAVEGDTIQRCWFYAGILPRSWRVLMPLGSTWTSDPGDTTEKLQFLGRQLAAMKLGPAGMSATEFSYVEDNVPTCEFEAPDPLADEPPRTRSARPSLLSEPIMVNDRAVLREFRRVARRATEILVGYAWAEYIMPGDLAAIFGINNT
ncbi:unnamed protein product [Closterium sp. Yama58-4]|nr:unnamed protein product [Closterium sp. Yama58-4]